MATVIELRQQRAALIQRAREIHETAEGAGRALEAVERENFDQIMTDARALNERIQRAEDLEAQAGLATTARPADEDPTGALGAIGGRADYAATDEYRSAFRRWIAWGPGGLTAGEIRALSQTTDAEGGYMTAPISVISRVWDRLKDLLFVRRMATVYQVNGAKSLGVPFVAAPMEDGSWTAEVAAADEDTALTFGRRELQPYMLTKLIKISMRLLRNVPNADQIVADQMAYRFAVSQERGFLTGSGTNEPLGLFVASPDGVPAARDVRAGALGEVTVDDVTRLKYSLKQPYWTNAVWIMHPDIALRLALLREGTGTGAYLWRESARVGEPATLLGHPVYMSTQAPNAVTANAYVAMLGDLSNYAIADAQSFTIQRLNELFAVNSQIGFIGRLEADGMPIIADAFGRLQMPAS